MEAENSSETSTAVHESASLHIREELNLQQQRCDNLKTCTLTILEKCYYQRFRGEINCEVDTEIMGARLLYLKL
jgi:hypothetical protein